jgi:RNA polymerase sigma-70 factor (ECF subfamily)
MSEDREARFTALYEAARARIVAYALRRTASREDAADVVAETFAIAWRRIDDVPDGHAGLLWLYVTARHVLANRARRLRSRGEVFNRLVGELRGAELADAPHDDASLLALFSLNSLPEEHREVLMLAGWEGLSAAEIGRVLGCSPTAARIRLHRARLRLNAEIGEISPASKRSDAPGHAPDEGLTLRCAPEEV